MRSLLVIIFFGTLIQFSEQISSRAQSTLSSEAFLSDDNQASCSQVNLSGQDKIVININQYEGKSPDVVININEYPNSSNSSADHSNSNTPSPSPAIDGPATPINGPGSATPINGPGSGTPITGPEPGTPITGPESGTPGYGTSEALNPGLLNNPNGFSSEEPTPQTEYPTDYVINTA